MRWITVVPAVVLLLGGCANSSKTKYDASDVGRMISTSEATIVSSRIVSITEQPQGYGPLAGAAIGATGAGLGIGKGTGAIAAGVLGGLLGAGAGYLVERSTRSREGIEYMVRTSDGRTQTLVQNREKSEEPIPAGTEVLVQHAGTYTRVIEKPVGAEDRWQDPDAATASGGGAAAGDPAATGSAGSSGAPKASRGAGSGIPGGPPGAGDPWGAPGRPGTIRPRQQ
jgi:outer membrane lipoprotein SlyB